MAKMKLKLEQVASNEWKFEYPHIVTSLHGKFYEALDLMNDGYSDESEKILRLIIEKSPEYIDAYHHLALLLLNREDITAAFQLWMKAVDIGTQCFPKKFTFGKDLLEWGWLDNRPFLRACESLGSVLYDIGEVEEALKIFNNILSLNPNDNQGIRSFAIQAHFDLEQPEEVLKICDCYPDDILADTLYGRPLALFQTGKRDQAEQYMKEAIESLPLIAKELTKKRHRRPKNMMDGYLTVGGQDEAYDYWQRSGKFWKDTEGAIGFVKDCLKK